MNEQIANTLTAVSQAVPQHSIPLPFDPMLLLAPFTWFPPVQKFILDFIFSSGPIALTVLKALVLLLPVVLFITGIWVTMASIYLLPFRKNRINFVVTMALSWWDILTSIWNYWVGSIKFVFLSFGWLWELIKITIVSLFVGFFRLIALPFKGASEMARRYSQGGVPWVAVTATVIWSILEATIFTYTLLPTITEVLANMTGIDNQALIVPFLFLFLFLLILGSFACLYVLIEAVKTKKVDQIVQMLLVEMFVLFFEVVFLYRELVDALTPWIAQQSNDTVHLGIAATLLLSAFLWAGIRGMTWFLFARFGTPTLIAVISRQKMEGDKPQETRKEILQETWENFIGVFKHNVDWFNDAGKKYMEAASLPVFQIIAAAVNITLVLFTSKTVFTIPFKSMEEVMNTKELMGSIMKKKEQG